jgi:hypothetical protein
MELTNQACATDDVSDSGNVDSPQLPSPVYIAQPSPNGSFFAQWFKVVDPNAPILEDQYFGRSGWALESDNFSDEAELDSYLKSDHKLIENESSDPFNLTLDGFASSDEEESDSEGESSASRENELEMGVGLLDPIGMVPLASDWSKMPPVLPALVEETAAEEQPPSLDVIKLEPLVSDWSKMPEILPPLPLQPTMSVPEMVHKTSDYVYVDSLVDIPPPQNDWNPETTLVDVESLHPHESVVPHQQGQHLIPATFYEAQASGHFTGHTGQMVPLYPNVPVYHLPFIVLGNTQLSFV